MKVVILAGGYGTRISEESHLRPKPLIEIGERPIICHIMSIYSHYGFNDFIICLGYKGYLIKEFFAHYFLHQSDVTFDFRNDNQMIVHNRCSEPWKVTLVDTGKDTMTGGRVKRIQPYVGEETFLLTYGDGVSSINIQELVDFHRSHGKWATVTATQPAGRFGALNLEEGNKITGFQEKPKGDGGWVNAGFFVMEPEVFNYIEGDRTTLEKEPLEALAKDGQLMAFKYPGFWQPMDTLRDKNYLEELWKSGKAEWKK
ncbi:MULTISPECIES: glucose-1-phosphate cytidylyltransferase [Brevibacillus]|uniref:glucose-1-phosphate cytidylyltransferase n=1 Tax=Brevibacillus TaxID=55080 RepID=UPI002E1E552B|nr:glucose-1-phosphate cytidylyltransferase [Brevibacillus choshinensis]MED4585424.1 glucose-1-phosphate cytidylyltransferase [Brevibacillus choshinensis]MED4753924.1 glucose-1-phosphate cytidylyltransferase [Brevibacillus choshinensis]MED4779054.1 glucose-1-phosphate cytidylyltransferase [Brevibacillus choshinensis]